MKAIEKEARAMLAQDKDESCNKRGCENTHSPLIHCFTIEPDEKAKETIPFGRFRPFPWHRLFYQGGYCLAHSIYSTQYGYDFQIADNALDNLESLITTLPE